MKTLRIWKFLRERRGTFVALGLASLLGVGCGQGGEPGEGTAAGGAGGPEIPRFVSLGTAPVGGTFYNVGAAISDALNQGKEVGGWRQATADNWISSSTWASATTTFRNTGLRSKRYLARSLRTASYSFSHSPACTKPCRRLCLGQTACARWQIKPC